MATPDENVPGHGSQISNFTDNLDGLREFLRIVEAFLQKETSDFLTKRAKDLIPLAFAVSATLASDPPLLPPEREEEIRARFGGQFDIEKTDGGGAKINVTGDAGQRFEQAIKGLSANTAHQQLLYQNCLVSLVSFAEWFLSQIIRQFFEAFPDAAGIKEKTLTLEDLRRIGSVTEAESYLISLRVDEIMWGSLEDWLKFLRNTVKLSMGYLSTEEDTLVEIFQRRNVIVHNNGTVHHSYMSKVAESLRTEIRAGQKLFVTTTYLKSSIDTVERSFVLLAAELWKKLAPKDEQRAEVLNKITIKALHSERYKVAMGASRFLMEDKQLQEKWLLYARLNFWQSKKWAGEFEEVKAEIVEADFSAKDDLIQLARFVLLDNFDSSVPLLKSLLQSKKLPIKDFGRMANIQIISGR
jgi:hypothetical protein